MCGIVGIAGAHEPQWLTEMNAAVRHRGPDDVGEYRDRGAQVGLAMHRLSILDLVGGRQPMSNEDGTLWIVHNGEIYNSPDLRSELEARGHRFITKNSDTEVLLHLYEEKQEELLADLNGMFAFVIYDRPSGVLFGARDRIGIKPLYYARRPSQFAFASELKSFLSLPWVSREIDLESLFHYMSLRFIPGTGSILQGIRRVPPGHWFRYSLRTHELEIRPYWRPNLRRQEERSRAEWCALIRQGLRDAVQRWTLSDVPVGVSLSGGLDSSTIVGLLGELGVSPIRTYSLGFTGPEEEEWNELPLARRVAERWATEHHEVILEPDDLLRDLLRMVWYLEEPYGGGLPSWYVFEFMRRDVKVGLTGTGGDELFGDYGRFARFEAVAANGSSGTMPWWAPAWQPIAALVSRVPDAWLGPRRKQELMHLPELRRDPFRWHYFNRYFYFPDDTKRASLFKRGTAGIPDTSQVLQESYRAAATASLRDAVGNVGFTTQLPEEFLLMTDRFSMARALEARVPFLDHQFVELVHQIPAEVRTRPGDLKYLLKEAVGDLLPKELLQARKRGFVIPTAGWLRGKLRPLADRLLSAERLKAQGIFQPDFYPRYVVPHLEGRADYHAEIWTALMFQLWHLLFIEEELSEPPTFSWQDLC
ncbi:MAG: asparagine synthase (glutamine-hydrolyzing) [Candidatus Methylomirabilales bacterium]